MAKSIVEVLLQEYRWERYFCWILGCVIAGTWLYDWSSSTADASTGTFLVGLMFIALGYLSDLRYRLFFEEKEKAAVGAAVEDPADEAVPGTEAVSGSGM